MDKTRQRKSGQKTGLLIGMITVAVAGLLTVQLVLLNIAWDLKDQAFQRNAMNALSETVRDLEAGEIANDALQVFVRAGENYGQVRSHLDFRASDIITHDIRGAEFDSTRLDATVVLKSTTGSDSLHWQRVTSVDSFITWEGEFRDQGEKRVQLIKHVVGDLVIAAPKPIGQRLQPARIDSTLRQNLQQVGIDIDPQFAVLTPEENLVLQSDAELSPSDTDVLVASPLRAELFPLDLRPSSHQILLHFPGQRGFLMRQIGPLLGASMLFLLLIIAAFVITLRKIDQQGRFFARIIDFINNMTHEFKTPISTVSLASEAIARPDILERPEALNRYNNMIRDENLRMRRQVEKILQIAQLEAGDFDLHLMQVDMNELTHDTADAFALQMESKGGSLTLDLQATNAMVQGDPVHLGNVLTNLIDNAIKYSTAEPQVRIKTTERNGQLQLEVLDRGPGIARKEQAHVFEKYYRAPTGNRHDVKGYGLGLSFVQLLVRAHGGKVWLESIPGQGTTVAMTLPLSLPHDSPAELPERSANE